MFYYILQMIIGLFLLMGATFFTWYEGSAIIEDSFEWKHSTPFTHMLGRQVTSGHDISSLDYFVYAIKFQPFFPLMMMLIALYLLSVTSYYVLKTQSIWRFVYCGVTGMVLISCSCFIFRSSVIGESIFFWLPFSVGLLFIVIAIAPLLKTYVLSRGEVKKS